MTYQVNLRVSHTTPSAEIWEAAGHGVTIKSKNPTSAWALAALDAGFEPMVPVQFIAANGTPSLRYRTINACAAPALKAREHFSKLTQQEAG